MPGPYASQPPRPRSEMSQIGRDIPGGPGLYTSHNPLVPGLRCPRLAGTSREGLGYTHPTTPLRPWSEISQIGRDIPGRPGLYTSHKPLRPWSEMSQIGGDILGRPGLYTSHNPLVPGLKCPRLTGTSREGLGCTHPTAPLVPGLRCPRLAGTSRECLGYMHPTTPWSQV